MITIPELIAQALGSFLTSDTRSRFGASHARLAEVVPFGRPADAGLHRQQRRAVSQHRTLDAGHARRARHPDGTADAGGRLPRRTMPISSWRAWPTTSDMSAEFCKAIPKEAYVADLSGLTVHLPRGSSDAALAPYHVDRSKLFVSERLDGTEEVDAGRIARAIEYTRFPYTFLFELRRRSDRGGGPAAARGRSDRSARRSQLPGKRRTRCSTNSRKSV